MISHRSALATLDDQAFLDLMRRLSPDQQRVVGALVQQVAIVEEAQGETAALSLIEDVSSILAGHETTH